MSHTAERNAIRFQGERIALLIEPRGTRLKARGQNLEFTDLDEVRAFVNDLNILLVEVEEAAQEVAAIGPNTDTETPIPK